MMTPSRFIKMRRNREAGQALIVTAVSLIFVLALIGFGVDIGILRYDKRLQQNAADAAAIAGADDLAHECLGDGGTDCTDWSTAAQSAASSLGFTDGTNNVTVAVNNPPSYWASDPHLGDGKYVEAVVTAVRPTFFERIIGVNQATVVARAEATYNAGGGSGNSCWWDLGAPQKEVGVDPSGSVTVNANCGIVDNGNYNPKGGALRINTCSFSVAGSDTGNGSGSSGDVKCDGQTQQPTYGQPTQQDPLYGRLTAPSIGTPQTFNTANPVPGTYNGINIPTGTTITFQPGVYVVTGKDLECQGSANISGNGVTFYFTNGATIQCTGNVTWDLTAPNSGNCSSCASDLQQYGILMWQDPCDSNTGFNSGTVGCNSNQGAAPPSICPPSFAKNGADTGPEINGNTGSSFNGVLYFPADQFYFSGNSGTVNVDTMISDSSCLSGNATINLVGTAGLGGGSGPLNSVLSHAVLVE